MITVIEPRQYIAALWSKPDPAQGQHYRLMKYVMRVDLEDKTLLHNVVTGQMVVLDQDERALLEGLPKPYSPDMAQLADVHFLVAETCDEHQQVLNMRRILRAIEDRYPETAIVHYTILPTTACNARCFYCYEQGLRTVTMSEETANDVVSFIASRCEGKPVQIRWFGGEPTVAIPRIDQICRGLRQRSVAFESRMTTNGYLLNEELIARIKQDWNLRDVMISLDGTEENYNRIKAYVHAEDNPYETVMRNIGHLLSQGMYVGLRMNFDRSNYMDFGGLLDELEKRYPGNPYLSLQPHQINPHYPGADEAAFLREIEWINEKTMEMEGLLRERGSPAKGRRLPYLKFRLCGASRDSVIVINPDGSLVKCPDSLGEEQIIGHIKQGITDREKVLSWKQGADYEQCHGCVLFPNCDIPQNCKGGNICLFKTKDMIGYRDSMTARYNAYLAKRDAASMESTEPDDSAIEPCE